MEWWKKLPEAWKMVVTIVTGIVLVIGTFQGVNAYYTKRCDFDEHKVRHNKDIAEISESFKKYQIQQEYRGVRQDIRNNSSEQYEIEIRLRELPTNKDRDRLRKLQIDKEELEKNLHEIKGR
jgi:hypothetical protein